MDTPLMNGLLCGALMAIILIGMAVLAKIFWYLFRKDASRWTEKIIEECKEEDDG